MAATSGANHSAIVTHHHRTETSASRRRHQAVTRTAIASTDTVASRGEPPLADHQATPGQSTPTLRCGRAPAPHEATARTTPLTQPAQRAHDAADTADADVVEDADDRPADVRAWRRSAMDDRLVTPREQAPPGRGPALHRDDVGVVETPAVELFVDQPDHHRAPDPHRRSMAHGDGGL